MKVYNKLVRDKIPEIIEATGKNYETTAVNKDDCIKYLIKKFDEEIEEFKEAYDTEELADILEIVHGLAYHLGVGMDELEKVRADKYATRGGFEDGIVLEKVW